MIRTVLLVSLFSLWSIFGWAQQPANAPEIIDPVNGQVLQSIVAISGSSRIPGFQSAELAFAYDVDPNSNWFILYESQEPVERGVITEWDTTRITDGNYRLRLRVYRDGADPVDTFSTGLRIRNYSPVETSTPEAAPTEAAVVIATEPQPAATRTAVLTPTPLPPNPILVTRQKLQVSLVYGLLIALAGFVVFGLYLALKRLFQRS
jgi:hypothetical protein